MKQLARATDTRSTATTAAKSTAAKSTAAKATSASTGPTSTGPPGPPESSSAHGDDRPTTGRRTLVAVIAVGALAGSGALATMWRSAEVARKDAVADLGVVAAERDASLGTSRTAADALIGIQADLDASRAANQQLQAQLSVVLGDEIADPDATATADSQTLESNPPTAAEKARSADLAAQIDELSINNRALVEQVAALQADLTTAQTSLAAANDVSAAGEAPPIQPVVFDVATAPQFLRWVGETLSSRNGSSRLSAGQSTCFGGAVVDAIGLDALGMGLHLGAESADNNRVVGAMQQAAASCEIDLDLIF